MKFILEREAAVTELKQEIEDQLFYFLFRFYKLMMETGNAI